MLPDRIELSTSPLPMECSTTELRQHARIRRIGQNGPYRRADPCHKAPARASARKVRRTTKIGKISAIGLPPCSSGRFWADPVPEFVGGPAGAGFSPIEGPVILSSGTAHKSGSTMTNDRDKGEGRQGHLAKKDARRDRLKQALRENLKRRKSQARGRNDIAPASSPDEAAAPHDVGGEKPGE